MTSKTKKKGKTTIPLADFLAGDSKLVTVRGNWSEIVDNEEAEETKPIVVDIGALPTAPRSAVDIDYSTLPADGPFKVLVANLSFEIDEEGLRRIFADLNPRAARVLRDGTRSRGLGIVEFETRENLIDGLKRTDKEVYGRKIRVSVSDKVDSHQNEGGRGFGNHRSNRAAGGEERSEMAGPWKRANPLPEASSDDRQSSGYNRDRQNRGDFGRSSTGGGGGGSRDNQQGNDFGFGYPRTRDDRTGGGTGRDYNRQGQRNRYQDDENRPSGGSDRPRYGGRYSDTRDTRDRNRTNDEPRSDQPRSDQPGSDQQEPPRERQRLQLQPRSKPLEDVQPLSGSSSSVNNVAANAEQSSTSNPDDPSSPSANTSNQLNRDSSINDDDQHDSNDPEQPTVKPSRGAGASIFGGAKPVDTAAKELEIERKLLETQISGNSETSANNEDRKPPPPRQYSRGGKRSSNTDEYRDRRGDGRSGHGGDYQNRQEHGGRQQDDEGRNRNDDDHPRRGGGGGSDRGRYSGPSRRDQDSTRANKYSQPDKDNERGDYRNRNQDTHESTNQVRPSNDNSNSDSHPRQPIRGTARRALPTDDESNRLQLSNKFGMLDDDDDLDDNNEHEDAQSPSVVDE